MPKGRAQADESDSEEEYESEAESRSESVKPGKAKGKAKAKDGEKVIKRRSSKACDNCRKSKCKCVRSNDPATNEPRAKCDNCEATNAECKYEGTSRKRGPPKGYIEAIESRLHRMEALLGGLLQNDDPRAQTLLVELIGDDQAREMLTQDLRAATERGSSAKPRKSWKKSDSPPSMPPPATISRGFAMPGQQQDDIPMSTSGTPRYLGFNDEDLGGFSTSNPSPGWAGPPMTGGPASYSASSFGYDASQYRNMSGRDSDEESRAARSPGVFHAAGVDIPVGGAESSSRHKTSPLGVAGASSSSLATSPRQRRKLNALSPPVPEGNTTAFTLQTQSKPVLPTNAIGHTGQAQYTLSHDADLSPGGEGDDGNPHQLGELADVVGQLSLNENSEVRYHGRSSGLYLISKSARYKNFFWQFPSAGVWPPTQGRVPKTETEILAIVGASSALPDRAIQHHLLELYWAYVHPHFPILYKVSFMRQWRHGLSEPDSVEPSTPSGQGKVPAVLLLSMFALAARYSDLEPHEADGGTNRTAGQYYLDQAQKVLNYDYGSSKLVTVQALLLMAYREIGTGAMSASWLFTGMAIRMAQDLGLFRDVDKWYLPVRQFKHEEKQTRKRVWWGCIILDRYTASYIGRPGTIHERDYDTSFPSEEEPDEQEQWRPLRPDGTEWSAMPKSGSETMPVDLSRYPALKANSISCFNAAGALAVIINRVIVNIYAIRIRVLGQSSETLLSLLDQSLASWYLALPQHLAYNPAVKKVPPPHVLALHLQFYSALILLHRPFIPGRSTDSSPNHFPSHSICTTSANAIATIITTFSKTFTLRQCPPFLTYPIFSAAVICVYNAGFDEALARPAKMYLSQCMDALKEMEVIWGSAIRQWELLNGLVDFTDAGNNAELQMAVDEVHRGTKRPAEAEAANMASFEPFGTPAAPRLHPQSAARTESSGSIPKAGAAPKPTRRRSNPPLGRAIPSIPVPPVHSLPVPQLPISPSAAQHQPHQPMANFGDLPLPPPGPLHFGFEGAQQSYDILSGTATPDLHQQQQYRPTSGQSYSELLQSYLAPTEAAGHNYRTDQILPLGSQSMDGHYGAFANFPMTGGGAMPDDWFNPSNFDPGFPQGYGGYPSADSVSPEARQA